MPTKRRARPRNETMIRQVDISSFSASVGLHVDEPKSPDPEIEVRPWLELRGTMNEAVRDTREIVFSVYPNSRTKVGTARPASVGSIIQVRPHLEVVASCPHADFDRIWALALTGHLKRAHLHFTKPRYSRALATEVSFSSEVEE